MKSISILGSTGSIGINTLNVIRLHPERFKVTALAAGSNLDLFAAQIKEFKPRLVSLEREEDALKLSSIVGPSVEVLYGAEGAESVAVYDNPDVTVSAITGAAGLLPTLAAAKAGGVVALANKESLVLAGSIVMAEAKKSGATIVPVDSEHSAIMQSLVGHRREDIKRIILTASGGPFLDRPQEDFVNITPQQALKHPNWDMGAKVTIDSATLLNKGLEVIEARWLFDLSPDEISVLVHPQSIVHSMVEYLDGSIISQMGAPDMRGPIAYALAYPERIETGVEPCDLTRGPLEFREPDMKKFPCLGLAYDALRAGGTMPAALNAADEVAVRAFLEGQVAFTAISGIIEDTLTRNAPGNGATIEEITSADRVARENARRAVKKVEL